MKFAMTARLLALPILCLGFAATSASAQSESDEIITPGGVLPAGVAYRPPNPAEALTFNLGLLARNPRDVTALTQAGLSALAVGDANAAIGFLGRAEQLSPGNGRIKLSLGSAMTMLERPLDAMHFFEEAFALGVAERDIARDRGLAWDMKGDQRRAQQDYKLVLRYGADDEVTRRLALSYGISGDKEPALRLLEPLIRKQDQAAWRNRAFILAMNGDLRGAERIVEQVMPYGMSNTMSPFLRRLATLGAGDRARAVNFGTIPADGASRLASIDQDTGFRAISGRVADALTAAPPPPVQVAVVQQDSRTRKKDKNRKSKGRDGQQQLALASPPLVATSAPRPGILPPPSDEDRAAAQPRPIDTRTAANGLTRRVGERIGPVDPARLPPELRDQGPGTKTADVRAIPVAGNVLPPPSSADRFIPQTATPSPSQSSALAQPPAVRVTPTESTPPPLFELPAKSPVVQVAVAPRPELGAPAPQIVGVSFSPASIRPANALPPSSALPLPQPVAASSSPRLIQPSTTPSSSGALPTPSPVSSALAQALIQPTPSSSSAFAAGVSPPARLEQPEVAPASVPQPAPGFGAAVTETAGPPATLVAVASEPAASTSAAPLPVASVSPPPAAQVTAPPAPAQVGLAAIIAKVETETESPAEAISVADLRKARLKAQLDAKAKADAKTKAEAEAAALEKEKQEKAVKRKHPERYWVQVGTGNNRAGLPGTFRKLREQAPDSLKSLPTAVAPFKSTNRLLVGPFKSLAEAKAKVNELAKKGISANAYTSDAGEEVSTVAVK